MTARLRLDPPASSAQLSGAELLVWTPEPWTLTGNVAVAVHPDETYVIGRRAGHDVRVIVAERRVRAGAGRWLAYLQPAYRSRPGRGDLSARVQADRRRRLSGAGGPIGAGQPRYRLAADSPSLRRRDRASPASCRSSTRSVRTGGSTGSVPVLSGLHFTDTDPAIIAYLSDRGLLFTARPRQLHRPHCWRCGTRLFRRLQLIVVPRTVRCGRPAADELRAGRLAPGRGAAARRRDRQLGGLGGVEDEVLGCAPADLEMRAGHLTCVSSLTELSELAGRDLLGADPHRPVIDRIEIVCRTCGGQARRVPDIIDSAYDAGAMPFAQHGAPMRHRADFDASGPAELLIAGGAQVRSWHYALLAIGSLVLGRTPVQAGLRCGDVLDSRGTADERPARQSQRAIPADRPARCRRRPVVLRRCGQAGCCGQGDRRGDLRRHAGGAAQVPQLRDAFQPVTRSWPPLASRGRRIPRQAGRFLTAGFSAKVSRRSPRSPPRSMTIVPIPRRGASSNSSTICRPGTFAGREIGSPATRDADRKERRWPRCGLHLRWRSRLMAPFTPYLSDHVWNLIRGGDSPDSVHLAQWPQAQETPGR